MDESGKESKKYSQTKGKKSEPKPASGWKPVEREFVQAFAKRKTHAALSADQKLIQE